ncbi:MAG TPA: von Willebrand factor type A domain-containing protein [Thermoanaerobaculia bacterium]|nr:von Willebrand factor type A domain-containing protein [Thermoanaerobaculia bacterium]
MKRFALLFLLFAVQPLIRGVVTATDGTPLPGVTVTLDGHSAVVTDAQGRFSIATTPGQHTLTAQLAGYGTAMHSINVPASGAVDVELALNPVVSEALVVTAQRAPRTTTTAYYAPILEHEWKDTGRNRVTTFSIDVDGASYANVRRFLNADEAPPADAVRIEEMINYFAYRYPEPTDGRPIAISSEVAGCPWAPEHRLMRVGLRGRTVEQWKLAPNNLVFLLDVSGSMEPEDRLPLVKRALAYLVGQLRGDDTASIVVYAGAAGVVLPKTSDKDMILAALDKLGAGGSTAGGEGIELAYKLAEESFLPNGNNRVILATDGDFNVGITEIKDLEKLIESKRKRGIYLTCIGVGDDNLNDGMMEMLAGKGNGNYYYLDSFDEAKKVFGRELVSTLVAVADDVKLQLEFDPAMVRSYRQIGYEDRVLANEDFADDSKDAGEIGSGQSVTALYELAMNPGAGTGCVATLRVRYKDPGAAASKEMTARIVDDGRSAWDASPDTQFAAAVAEMGMLLRNSPHSGRASWKDVAALARATRGEDLDNTRGELLKLAEIARVAGAKN